MTVKPKSSNHKSRWLQIGDLKRQRRTDKGSQNSKTQNLELAFVMQIGRKENKENCENRSEDKEEASDGKKGDENFQLKQDPLNQ